MENPRWKQLNSERRLTFIYFTCAILSTISLICTAVVLGYWHDTLNSCLGQEELGYKHCGCLLYAKSTYRLFIGGDTIICHFVEFANIPGIVVGLCLGVWHWYRITFTLKKIPRNKRRRAVTKNDNNDVPTVIEVRKPSNCSTASWICCAIVLLFESLLCLTAAVLFTDGALKACDEYRQNIIETIHADGNMAALIKSRLFCNSVFDFMDYLQPIKYRHSANFINSGAAIYITMFSMWFAAIGWVYAIVGSVYEAIRYRNKCCGN